MNTPAIPAPDPAEPVPDIATVQGNVRIILPAAIQFSSQYDTEGRLWPGAGIHHAHNLSVVDLEALGVTLTWTKPDGSVLDADTAKLLIASRQSDADQGVRPVWPTTTPPEPPHTPLPATGVTP